MEEEMEDWEGGREGGMEEEERGMEEERAGT